MHFQCYFNFHDDEAMIYSALKMRKADIKVPLHKHSKQFQYNTVYRKKYFGVYLKMLHCFKYIESFIRIGEVRWKMLNVEQVCIKSHHSFTFQIKLSFSYPKRKLQIQGWIYVRKSDLLSQGARPARCA